MAMEWVTNIYLWMILCLVFVCLFILSFIFIIWLAKKTHAIVEWKASLRGVPICLFFQDNRYCEWRPIRPEAGIVTDKDYGSYIVNERGTYIDRRTKAVLMPFDANIGVGLNVRAAKLMDDFVWIVKDEEEMKKLRRAIAYDEIEEDARINVLKTSIHFGAVKAMLSSILPHNITSKIEKIIAQRMAGYGKINVQQVVFLFIAIFGAITLGALVIRLAFPKPSTG